ncbi:CLUMA_CG007235, isoform A [Clunio marinus]|uniref:CLUMA_CG007235, isoform A n=1 Tax=Clunio marinus TaxID=568069 RepID=A0A1J1I0I6_9DIPT|nr:CLUMA_CG007235, isoform A [Clunio marinus]
MLGIKFLLIDLNQPPFQFITAFFIASSNAIFFGSWSGPVRNKVETVTVAPAIQQYPISYIRAFAYQPVAFPQPLAPITTYHVSRNPQAYPTKNVQSNSNQFNNAVLQAMQQQLFKNRDSSNEFPSFPPMMQQLPLDSQVDFGTTPTTTTTTTTTTPAPTQPPSQVHVRPEPYQRQIPIPQAFQQGNFGGFPQYYNQQYSQPNPFQFTGQSNMANQFSGRLFSNEPSYQQYSADPVTYQFIPTSITPLPNQNNNNNNVKYVPCMCPVAVSISPPLNEPEKRTDEIPLLSPTPEPDRLLQSFQASTQLSEEENK